MRCAQRGDTIIEMMLAFAIFTLAAVGAMSILSSGVAITQRNLESTLVRQQIDTQAEMLRYVHDTQNTAWASVVNPANLTTSPASLDLGGECPTVPTDSKLSKGFFIQPTPGADPTTTTFTRRSIDSTVFRSPTTYARIDYANAKSDAVWVQAVKAEEGANGITAYDFYIHACWGAVGMGRPMTMGTIVRLYEK